MADSWKAAFLDFHRHVNEMFEELIYRRWAIPGRVAWSPPLDLHELPDAYLVEIDLPGVPPKDVRILANERNLTITGERQPTRSEGSLMNRCERQSGAFHRSLSFTQSVEPEKAQAECRFGTYRIRLPKKRQEEQAKDASLAMATSHYVIQVTVR